MHPQPHEPPVEIQPTEAEMIANSKAGIVTTDLMLLDVSPRGLIGQLDRERSGPPMAATDACNARFGRGSIVPARAGLVDKRTWSTTFEMRTRRDTSQVGELPTAVAG